MLMNYPDEASAQILYNGFTYGFPINYTGPRTPVECNNLKSIYKKPTKSIRINSAKLILIAYLVIMIKDQFQICGVLK